VKKRRNLKHIAMNTDGSIGRQRGHLQIDDIQPSKVIIPKRDEFVIICDDIVVNTF